MSRLQPVRGTHDILPEDGRRHRHVVETAREQSERYGFAEISTPIFEFTDVFQRTLGETSDVVTKEMYTFQDRGGDEITLRPEYTAGIARAVISGGLSQQLPLRFFAHGPMFRYERPQKGRLRQFHQIDAEIIGVTGPQADIEIICLGAEILDNLGVLDRTELQINSLGDAESRHAYRDALVAYFGAHRDALSTESQRRLERNPLRILDSKDEGDRALVAEAPRMEDYLNEDSAGFFSEVVAGLKALGVSYSQNPHLVRGLDYYSHTAFEFVTGELGAQGAVIAGGRYDGLIETMGGTPTPAVGWAGGIERLAMLATGAPEAPRPIALIPVGDTAQDAAMLLAYELRRAGFVVDFGYRGNVTRRMKRADRIGARAALLLGEDEIERGVITLRDLDSGEQQELTRDALDAALNSLY
ncbi:MAG: histidine--tRNA ligase [Alphaproteobacteria bacterium]|nr:histidine--tRNA ligase [Alphaproteobacteria bacterium]